LNPLFKQGYDAIFIAIGTHQNIQMGVEGEDSKGVIDCLSFLKNVNYSKAFKLGKRVAVIGGGNAAIDAARTALRLDTDQVTILYRRTRDEMPANKVEVDEAILEGVDFQFLVTPQKISHQNGTVKLECTKCKLGEPDKSGRRCPVPIKESEFTLEFDTVLTAIGQKPNIPIDFGLKTGKGNRLLVDPETFETNIKGVFAGGDVVSGPASIIEAIASGRKATVAIDKYLGGIGVIDEPLIHFKDDNPYLGKIEQFGHLHREKTCTISSKRRIKHFNEVDLGFDEKSAIREASRCLRCSLRLEISTVKRPPIDVKAV
jgi:NADPH-dependent glutamate synthase beta subunit-like oxidoreductase